MRRLLIPVALALAATIGEVSAGSVPDVFPADGRTHRISVRVLPELRSMSDLPDLYLRNARERMLRGAPVPDAALRRLAELGDGLAAGRLVQRLRDRPGASASDIAYFAAIATGTGNVWSLDDMIEALHRLTPGTEPAVRLRLYIRVLYAHAWAGNQRALRAVAMLNGEGRLFGPLSAATEARLAEHSGKSDDGRDALRMALRLMETRPLDARRAALAETYLARAAGSDHPGIASAALAMRRLLDEPDDPGG